MNPKFRGAPLAKGHTHFLFWWDLMIGLGKPQLHAKFEVIGFIYYGNMTEFVFKRQIEKRLADFLFEIIELFC